MRALAERALFRMAAPSGGILLIVGWLLAAFAAALAAASPADDPVSPAPEA
jgi:uncharacterized membrane protein YgdD (TMEM256/DUF423 family)